VDWLGNEPDLRRWILGYPILVAPSHDFLFWLVDLGALGMVLGRCNLTGLVPESDPFAPIWLVSNPTVNRDPLFAQILNRRGHCSEPVRGCTVLAETSEAMVVPSMPLKQWC
jgi:hypothetical protein